MADDYSKPVWRHWAAELRRLRLQSGLTQAGLSDVSLVARSTISALERGTRTPKQDQAEALDRALATGGSLTRKRQETLKERDVPEWWQDALALEQRSQEIWEYEPTLVPGLLQTEAYARAVIRSGQVRATPKAVEKEVQLRIGRLPKLKELGLPLFSFITTEQALMRQGDSTVMLEQLDRIESLIVDGTIRLQILPDSAIPPGANLPFRINILDEKTSVAYLEFCTGGVTKDSPETIATLKTLFNRLMAESLSTKETLQWIAKARAKWNGERVATVAPREIASK